MSWQLTSTLSHSFWGNLIIHNISLLCFSIRVSPFTDEEMLREKLTMYFGDIDFEDSVLEFMIILIHIDLEHGNSLKYNGPAGLLDLYIAAGGSKDTDRMQAELFKIQQAIQKTDPLIKDLRKKFDFCRLTGVGNETSELQRWSKQRSKKHILTINVDEEKKDEHETRRKSDCDADFFKGSRSTIKAITKFRRLSAVARVDDSLSYDEFYQGESFNMFCSWLTNIAI